MRRLVVISGAGLSVESGVRAFRTDTATGKALWGGSTEDDQYDIDQVCNIHAFRGDFYHLTHTFYNKRRVELGTVEPNLAHLRIAEWYKAFPGQVFNITTNVDDLLERAGVPRAEILHVHGYLPEIVVENEAGSPKEIIDVGYTEIDPDKYGWCKPNVVFFGEMAPAYMDLYNMVDDLTSQDLVVIIGCSNQVIDFTGEIIGKVRRNGVKLWVVNPKPSHGELILHEQGDITVWNCGAVEAVSRPGLIKAVEKHLEG